MRIYLASDHAGFDLKEIVKAHFLEKSEHELIDLGALEKKEGDDYPLFMANAGRSVHDDAFTDPSYAIIFGGSGAGEAIVANRFPHVRAVVYQGASLELIKLAREHNDANVLALGARFVSAESALDAINLFLTTSFSHDERHAERIIQIDELTKKDAV
jgi:ribose 5-phosphate isomerase B